MQISDDMIKRICSSMIYKRGAEYFSEGRVHMRRRTEQELTAVVDSDELYNVSISFEDGNISDMLCTCAYFETMHTACKHIVAVLKQRQAELETGGMLINDNDKLARALCNEFEPRSEKTRIRALFTLFANRAQNGEPVFGISVSLPEYGGELQRLSEFLRCYLSYTDFKIDRKTVYNRRTMYFADNEEGVISIIAEVFQTRSYGDGINTGDISITFGSSVVRRILPYFAKLDFKLVYDGIVMGGVRISDEDPDIPMDIEAFGREISLSLSESGFAMTTDGEWFLHNSTIYKTSAEWREYFMPIYRTLAVENRTQVIFKGDNTMLFAKNVLPRLKNKYGVVISGVNDIVVNSEPEFEICLDAEDNGITAVIAAVYGDIKFRIPTEKSAANEKIIIRRLDMEDRILSFFDGFDRTGQVFKLNDDKSVFEFISRDLKILSVMSTLIMTDRFKDMTASDNVDLSLGLSYRSDMDFLEISFDTSLTQREIAEIVSAMRNGAGYYRTDSGWFIDFSDNRKSDVLKLLEQLDFSESDISEGRKRIPKSYLLYLNSRGDITKEESVKEYIAEIKSTEGVIPPGLEAVIRPYQRDGITWLTQLSKMDMGGILADDMGLGKTLQVIAFIHGIKPKRPTLVVTPSSLAYNWQTEIDKFIPDAKALIITGTKEMRAELIKTVSDYEFVITTYPLLRRDSALYKNIEFAYFFIDEAQYIKNPKTMNAISVKRIKAEHKFALTGTPIENSLTELWSIFDFVMRGYLKSRGEFRNRFEIPLIRDGNTAAADTLRGIIQPFIMRRMKSDVLSELPPKIETVMTAELNREQKALYINYLNEARRQAYSILSENGSRIILLTLLLRLRQICCHPGLFMSEELNAGGSGKLELLLELIKGGTGSGHRMLIFSQFRSMLDIIADMLNSEGIEYFYINGSTPAQERVDISSRFNSGERALVLVSLKAGGTGLNLVGADMVIHYDPWWNPAVTDQATDRAYRIGQTRSVQVIKLVAKGTIEEKILKLQERKKLLADDIIRENHDTINTLSDDEIMSLFEF